MRTGKVIAACLLWMGAGVLFPPRSRAQSIENDGKLTAEGLQGMLEAFADRSSERVSEVAQRAADAGRSDDVRLRCRRMRLYYASSVLGAAMEQDSPSGLLDIMVSISLERWILSSPRSEILYGKTGARLFREVFEPLESQAWEMGARVFRPEQLDELRGMMEAWKKENPGALTAHLVRFGEIAREKPGSMLSLDHWGLLAPVKEANRQVEQARRLGERALFFVQRIPTLARWHGMDFVQESLADPQVKRLVNQYDPGRVLTDVDRVLRGWIDVVFLRLLQAAAALLGMLLLYRLALAGISWVGRPPPARSEGDRRRPHSRPAEGVGRIFPPRP